MFSIDLQDTFPDPSPLESRPYLHFCLEERVYQFKALCFGISMAPQVCTSLRSGFRLGAWEGRAPFPLSGRLAGGCGVAVPASSPSGPSTVVHRCRDCGQLEEVRTHS